jgi:DNA-binding MarR family transcriptional regulator
MKRALELKLSEYSITSSQYTVIDVLGKYNGISLTELGRILDFDNPTITGIINRMARAKLIRRNRDRNDRRIIKVYLTQKGKELHSILPQIAEDVNKKAVENFTKIEKYSILNLSKRLYKNLANKK